MTSTDTPPTCSYGVSDGDDEMTVSTPTVSRALCNFHAESPTVEQPARLRQQLAALAHACCPDDSNLSLALQLVESLFDTRKPDQSTLPLTNRDLVFARNLERLKPIVVSAGKLRPSGVTARQSDKSEDCIADCANEWSVFRVLNLALMASIPARKRVAVVTSVRNEGAFILEWLAHCRATGLESFFVYTNDNTDGSGHLLRTLADFGVINLIENIVGPDVRIQGKILEHSLHLLPELREFEWVFYIDVDEFFIPRCEPGLTLDSFYQNLHRVFPADLPSSICINWKWFGSENAFEASEGLLMDRFMYSIHNQHVKSLVKLKDVMSMHRVHVPILLDGAWMVNSAFERVEPAIEMRPTYGHGQLNHYWNKSFKEFVLKRARGRISRGLDGTPLDFSTFFDWGANGRRGNLDRPDARVIERLKKEYVALMSIANVYENLQAIKSCHEKLLRDLNRDLDIAGVYERRGRPG